MFLFKALFSFFLFNILFHLNALSQLPVCKDSFPTSLLSNNSFEQYSGCFTDYGGVLEGGYIDEPPLYGGITINNWHAFYTGRQVSYFNYACRTNKPGSIFDSTNFSSDCYFPKVPRPLPDGLGFIAIEENDIKQFVPEDEIAKDYLTACLSQPLYAGQTYLLSFYFGFGTKPATGCSQTYQSQSPYGVAVFGRQDCPDYPLKEPDLKSGCLTNKSGWVQLGRIILKGEGEWVQAVIEFTPQTNIACIGIGPDCANNSLNADFYYTTPIHYADKFILAPKADFSFKAITAVSGNACTGNLVLQAPSYANAAYQWYKDGVLITNATARLYAVTGTALAAGAYTANISLPYNTCLNTLPYQVYFSDLNKFSLGNDTLACTPKEVYLNAAWPTAVKYLWQDGSENYAFTANKTGTYWVQLTDINGCSKKDSVNVTIQGCDDCKIFIPSAFTPNNDGRNDVFRAIPQCTNIGLQWFVMRVYNRWGQLVFTSRDMRAGWDGTYNHQPLDAGVYIYVVDYSYKQDKALSQKGTIMLMR